MTLEEMKKQIELLFNPEPDEGGVGRRAFACPRLEKTHGLDLSYLKTIDWEGSSIHPHTRLCGAHEGALDLLTRNSDMPERLMFSALQILADSMLAYFDKDKREGEIRYYPAIVFTLWSGFECFVRHSSEILLLTVPDVPAPVVHFLRETENVVEANGTIGTRARYQSVLDRYSVFIFHAYGHKIDRGSSFWQELKEAKALRDYYTHLDVNAPRAITTADVISFIERTLLGLIWPSSILQRTFMLDQYSLYEIWAELREYAKEYRERPFFMDWHLKEPRLFHCNYEGVDASRLPSVRDDNYHEAFKARVREHRDGEQE
jgi:hypothetical protein